MCRTTGSSSGSHTDVTFRVFMHAGQRGGALYILEPLFLIACNAGDGSFSFSFNYSCLGNPVERGAWWAIDHAGHKELDKP